MAGRLGIGFTTCWLASVLNIISGLENDLIGLLYEIWIIA